MNLCKHCNSTELKPRARICTSCSKKNKAEYGKQYYRKNREKILNSKKNDDAKERRKKHNREYYLKNREQIIEKNRLWAIKNKASDSARRQKYNAQYYLENCEKIRERNRIYYWLNSNQILERQRRNRPVFFSIIENIDSPYELQINDTIEIDDVFSVISDDEKNVLNRILKNGGDVDYAEMNDELEEIRKKVLNVYG